MKIFTIEFFWAESICVWKKAKKKINVSSDACAVKNQLVKTQTITIKPD